MGFLQTPVRVDEQRRHSQPPDAAGDQRRLVRAGPTYRRFEHSEPRFRQSRARRERGVAGERHRHALLSLRPIQLRSARRREGKPQPLHPRSHLRAVHHRVGVSRGRARGPRDCREAVEAQARRRLLYARTGGELSRRADARSVVRGRQGGLRLSRPGGRRSDGGGRGGLCRASEDNPYRRSGLRVGRLPDFGVSPASGGADRGGPRCGTGARRARLAPSTRRR